ncbi:MAG TPA: hypothetical protein VFN69_04530 [Rudaea sp.]|nr:hypothetical protein [Rudaea sp.]
MKRRDPMSRGEPPFSLPKVESFSDAGPRGCDDLTPALLCFIAGAVAFVAFIAIAWGFA